MYSAAKKFRCYHPKCNYETIHPSTYKRHISTPHTDSFLMKQRDRIGRVRDGYYPNQVKKMKYESSTTEEEEEREDGSEEEDEREEGEETEGSGEEDEREEEGS